MNTVKRILVVDDEETLCEALSFNLEAEGYSVDTAQSAEQALTLSLADYDLVLLDIMMGEISGIQLAKIMKTNPATASIPVIFCTAKDTEDDVITGLDLGADDYITKPYSLRTLMARVRSVLRRTSAATQTQDDGANDTVSYKGLSLSPSQKTCTVDGVNVKMPRKEYEILFKLLSNKGRIYSRSDLLKEIWPDEVVVVDRVVDVNITRIRQKIGPYAANLVTKSGYGYGFVDSE